VAHVDEPGPVIGGIPDEVYESVRRRVSEEEKGDAMGKLVHVSKVKVYKEPGKGKVKKAYIEGFPEPIRMGVHGGIKKFFGVESGEELPATLDYLVAAVGSCLTGTLAGALEARSIPSEPDKVSAEVEGYIENVESKPLVTRIHVKYRLKVPKGKKAEAQRAIDHHEKNCAVSQTIRHGIVIECEGEIEEE